MQPQRAPEPAAATAAVLTWQPLSPALGAEILGVDLRRQNDDRVFAQIEQIWHQNLVILLRDQELSEDDEAASQRNSARRPRSTPRSSCAAIRR